ncbi:MAG: protoheme IX farnesyltransferase [Halobacteriovoraceae bacterium]|nr:protoheme IX farnesyltransferase [Halobacteriovoraceae bacterium]
MTKRLSLIAIFVTFSLLLWGGFVHNTQSSLACPDWPLCYGQLFPKMEGGIFIEHGHRLLASLVGFLTLLLLFFANKDYKKNKLNKYNRIIFQYSCLALFFVIIQGLLGGITVIYQLPTIVSTSHLGLSMIFFCTLIFINHQCIVKETYELGDSLIFENSIHSESEKISSQWPGELKNSAFIICMLIYSQMILGAFMRHSAAGASCGLGSKNSILCLDTLKWETTLWPSTAQAQLHMLHRVYAILVFLLIVYFVIKNIKLMNILSNEFKSFVKKQKIYLVGLILIILLQIKLGILTIAFNMLPFPTTAHLAGAALSLGVAWKIFLTYRSAQEELHPRGLHTFFEDVIDLTKPKLSSLVMLTALVGLILVPEHINFFRALASLVLIAMVVSGATSLNCLIEKDIDKTMERTLDRPLPAGRVSSKFVMILGTSLLGISIPLLWPVVNPLTSILGLIAALSYLFVYTPLKRKSHLAVFAGALPGAIPPLMGWTTVTGTFAPMAWSLFAILFAWQIPHFMAISVIYSKDYANAGIRVYPNVKGIRQTIQNVFTYTILLIGASLLPAKYAGAGRPYEIFAIIIGLVMLAISLQGFYKYRNGQEELKEWGKKYFWASIFYLPLLLGALLFLK